MKTTLNLPNRITVARLGLAVVFFVLLSQYSQLSPKPWMLDAAAVMFIVAAATDIVDGYIARKRGLVTSLGRVLDPLVDKMLVCGAFILFVGPGFVDANGHNVTEFKAWMVVVHAAMMTPFPLRMKAPSNLAISFTESPIESSRMFRSFSVYPLNGLMRPGKQYF